MSHFEKCCQNNQGWRWGVAAQQGSPKVNPSHSKVSIFRGRSSLSLGVRSKHPFFTSQKEELRGYTKPPCRKSPLVPTSNAELQVQKWMQDAANVPLQLGSKQLGWQAKYCGWEKVQELSSDRVFKKEIPNLDWNVHHPHSQSFLPEKESEKSNVNTTFSCQSE